MAGKEPTVVHRHVERRCARESGEFAKVEIPAVQVVGMNDIGSDGREVEQRARRGKAELLAAKTAVERRQNALSLW
jgi:hypothetical protein